MMDELNDISLDPAYLVACFLGLALWVDIRRDLSRLISGRNVVLGGIGAWYLLEAIMLPDTLRGYSRAQYNAGLLHVGLAIAAFLIGYHCTLGCPVFPALGEKITFFDDEQWLWRLVLAGAIIGFTPVVYLTGTQFVEMFEGMMGMRATWGGLIGRGRYGGVREAFLMLEMFVIGVAPFAVILLFGKNSTLAQRLICGLVLCWPVLRGYGSGTRSSFIASGCIVFAYFFWKAAPALRKTMIVAALICCPLFYGLMAAIVASRDSGSLAWEERSKVEYVGNEMFRELLFIMSKVPAEVDYQLGYLYYNQLVNPIPRFLWPDKPVGDSGLLMARMYGEVTPEGEPTMTISPGLLGEMYLSFGVIGILGLSAFGGWLVKGWDLIPGRYGNSMSAMMYYSAGLGILFIMGRSFSMPMFYGLLSLALLALMMRSLNPSAVVEVDR